MTLKIRISGWVLPRAATLSRLASIVFVCAVFAGCAGQQNPFVKSKAAPAPVAVEPVAAAPAAAAAPFSMSAKATGPMVNFTLTNNGSAPITVSAADYARSFALIKRGSRSVEAYNPETCTLELPEPATIAPGQSINGRAIFTSSTDPVGDRLVFRHDGQATFAVVGR